MTYYLRERADHSHPALEAWNVDDDVAFRIGVFEPARQQNCFFRAEPGKTIWETIRDQTDWFDPKGSNPFHEARLKPGEYYSRMARPHDQHPLEAPGHNPGVQQCADFVAIARSQLTVFTRQLDRICQTVHPTAQTLDTFGHDIRNLLIIACTEVEVHWRGVLIANGVPARRFSTNDYVALLPAMKLDEYSVGFPSYPWLESRQPYKGWSRMARPTQDLEWYDAYNAVKHNRETEFARATLRNVFDAVSACVIAMSAQFGWAEGIGQRSDIDSFFRLSSVPRWHPSEVYIYPYSSSPAPAAWTPVNFPFAI